MLAKPTQCGALPEISAIVGDLEMAPAAALESGRIAWQAANLLYDEVKSGNGLAGACRFVEFLRRHQGVAPDERLSFDLNDLITLVSLVADSPVERKGTVLGLIESALGRPCPAA